MARCDGARAPRHAQMPASMRRLERERARLGLEPDGAQAGDGAAQQDRLERQPLARLREQQLVSTVSPTRFAAAACC